MIDDRQYFIGKVVFLDWNNIALQKDMILSYHEQLPMVHNFDRSCIILGDAWQADPVQNSPNEIIQGWDANTSEDEIYGKEESWCGRYILIVGSRLFQDATSQLTTFFDDRGNVSGSLKLLREACGGVFRTLK